MNQRLNNSLLLLMVCLTMSATAQELVWQQTVDYQMKIDLDVETHKMDGLQIVTYFNHSPDTLNRIFYHLYFNAFQPNSMMDVRSRNLPDPDPRVGDHILHLSPEEQGYLRINSLKQNGKNLSYETVGTILEVDLSVPILPGDSATFEMEYTGQVPYMVRRSGRDNKEGISYSMGQWYPKVCAYDDQGWHANPYVSREFYGEFGNFDVAISIDRDYILAATGVLQNKAEIGYGYTDTKAKKSRRGNLTWHFIAENVHDFVWTADPDYTHSRITTDDGVELHFFYQKNKKTEDSWAALPTIMKAAYELLVEKFGPYAYPQYSFIQGGDHGMEYPMATLLNGERSVGALSGTAIHELTHSWFHGMLGSNESLYAWMDEGFTEYGETYVQNELRALELIPGRYATNPYVDIYEGYRRVLKLGVEEPMSTHSDHFLTNTAYGMAAYNKGAIFLKQLEYIVGDSMFEKAMKQYVRTWRFRHPTGRDVIRIFEKVARVELDWYYEYFINSVKVIEYEVSDLEVDDSGTIVYLSRLGTLPMPIDVEITYKDGSVTYHTIPLRIMRNAKHQDGNMQFQVEKDWPWTHPAYQFTIPSDQGPVDSVRIDPSLRLADFDLSNNLKVASEN